MRTTRAELLRRGAGGAALLALGATGLGRARIAKAADVGPYGPLGPPDANGLRLPAGFTSRLLAVTGQPVAATAYIWHEQPDGGQTFAVRGGGWVLAQNGEDNGQRGGASVLRFDRDGSVVDAYRILTGTKWNCAGGATPWGTWLSCEEYPGGLVWECDPFRPGQGVARPALGSFTHEAAPTHPRTGDVYLTEDAFDSRLYRFRPTRPGDLGAGTLEAAAVAANGAVTWVTVPPGRGYRGRDTTPFQRGEGAWISRDILYFTTTADDRVWALDLLASQLRMIYDGASGGALQNPDNVTVHEPTGHLYVGEDGDDLQLVLLARAGSTWTASPFMQLVGHGGSEVCGGAFSPDHRRLYVNSQRGTDTKNGRTYEITGPFASA
jgi:uncharacterized protein